MSLQQRLAHPCCDGLDWLHHHNARVPKACKPLSLLAYPTPLRHRRPRSPPCRLSIPARQLRARPSAVRGLGITSSAHRGDRASAHAPGRRAVLPQLPHTVIIPLGRHERQYPYQ